MARLWYALSLAGMVALLGAWSAASSRLYWTAASGVLAAVVLLALSARRLPEGDR
jgi:hypothetical protein